ncbi:hypothetical protein HPB50_016471 [Hyalomma asiaticum]|uniref:Uncharacterized protein n=1 Tax=Hyalomma asiaticum TaxID=266040 RepID=A0ACB7RV14_HYAAI|nr:hypothetical protein HPB50_016471 [Hyalomma asiaticum]
MMDDTRGLFPWRRRPEHHDYYRDPRELRQEGEAEWRDRHSFPHYVQRPHQDGLEGVPGRSHYYEFPRPTHRDPYHREPYVEPPPVARHGPHVAPSHQVPSRPSYVLPRRAEPLPQPLPYAHKQPPVVPAPLPKVAPPVASTHSRHHQPYAPAAPIVAPTRPAPTAAAPPLPAKSGPSATAPKPPAMVAAAPPKPVASWQPVHKQPAVQSHGTRYKDERAPKPKHHRKREESMMTTSLAASPRSTTGSSSSSSSSETARVIRMMKTRNLPKPPPDNWQSAVRLATVVVLSGTVFSLVMVLAYILETTVLLPWDNVNTDVVTNVHGLDDGTVEVAFGDNTTAVEGFMANDTSVELQDVVDYNGDVGDTAALV